MGKKANGSKAKPERLQIVLKVPAEVRALLEKAAHDGYCSMNQAATTRLATGRWPQARKEAQK